MFLYQIVSFQSFSLTHKKINNFGCQIVSFNLSLSLSQKYKNFVCVVCKLQSFISLSLSLSLSLSVSQKRFLLSSQICELSIFFCLLKDQSFVTKLESFSLFSLCLSQKKRTFLLPKFVNFNFFLLLSVTKRMIFLLVCVGFDDVHL